MSNDDLGTVGKLARILAKFSCDGFVPIIIYKFTKPNFEKKEFILWH